MPVDTDSQEYFNFKDVKASANVRVVLASLGLLKALETRKNELVGVCMLGDERHGKSDSFAFNVEKKTFQCFACKQRGSILDFCAKYIGGGATLREGAQYVDVIMKEAGAIAGADADEDALVVAITKDTDSKVAEKMRAKRKEKPVETKPIPELAQAVDRDSTEPLNIADLQNAVMSWSLAEYRVKDGKLNPDELVVVDVSTLEFMRQLTMPKDSA